jgi:hypothetical protein
MAWSQPDREKEFFPATIVLFTGCTSYPYENSPGGTWRWEGEQPAACGGSIWGNINWRVSRRICRQCSIKSEYDTLGEVFKG